MTAPLDTVRQGVLLALTAEQQGLLDEHGLSVVLAYYERQGRRGSLSPDQVLVQLGGLSQEGVQQVRTAPLVNVSLGQYPFAERLQPLGSLGEGGMGAVYRAYDKLLRRVVALKLIRPERLGLNARRVLQRFEREAQVMARIRHPNCVAIHSADQLRGQPILIMEYVRGESLMQRIEREGALDPKQVATWGRDLAYGLESCHGVGVVHRDVKPANILLDASNCPRLTDFGIALDTDARTKLTADAAAIGTLAYMPPEQALGKAADSRSDVYSLGATLFEALTGELVFPTDQPLLLLHQISTERAREAWSVRENIPLDLSRVIGKCLEKLPGDRYGSASELAADLDRFVSGRPVAARPLGVAARLIRGAKRQRRTLSLLGAVFGIVGLAALIGAVAANTKLVRAETAELERASALEDPAASIAALTSLAARATPKVALAASQARERALLREGLEEARACITALEEALTKRELNWQMQSRLENRGVTGFPIKSQEKQDYLRLRATARELDAEISEWSLRGRLALRTVQQRQPDSQELAVEWSRFLAIAADMEPVSEEARKLRNEAAAMLLDHGLNLPEGLQASRVMVEVKGGPARVTVQQLHLDRVTGLWASGPEKSLEPSVLINRSAGDYLFTIRWTDKPDKSLPVPIRLFRGPVTQVSVSRPLSLDRDWLWEEFAYVVPGLTWTDQGGGRAKQFYFPSEVEDFYVGRTEVLVEGWYSYRCALGWPSEEETPTGQLDVGAQGPPNVAMRRLPVGNVTLTELRPFLDWLELEFARARLSLRPSLPDMWLYGRALRGPFDWVFPWGSHFDSEYVATGSLPPAKSGALDKSVFGVFDLVSSVAEFCRAPPKIAAEVGVSQGATSLDSWVRTRAAVINTSVGAIDYRSKYLGFRVYATATELPDLTRDPKTCAAKRKEALRLAALTDYLGANREATAAIDADPLNVEAWLLRATARLRLSDFWGANFDASRAVELDSERVEAWGLLGTAQGERGEYAQSIKAWDRVLKLRPRMADAYRMRAHAKAKLKDAVGALEDLDQFERLAPANHAMRADADALRASLGD